MRFFDEIWMPWRKIVRRSDQTVYLAANGRGRPADASGGRALIAEIHPVYGQHCIFVTVTKLPGNGARWRQRFALCRAARTSGRSYPTIACAQLG